MLSAIYVAAALVVTSAQYAVISTAIGTGTAGYGGDGGQATASELNYPSGVTVYANQNIFIADSGNNVVRLVAPSGIISTVVGTGVAGYAGDGGPATAARLDNPISIAFDGFGNFVIADNLNHRIREVTPSGIISTVAGTGACGYSGDGGPATAAELCDPMGVLFDAGDNLLFVAYFNNCVRKVTPSGVISTVAGTGVSGFSGDGGPATLAKLGQPTGIAVDASGNLFIADRNNNRVRKVASNGVISTVAGTGGFSYAGDGGYATAAALSVSSVAINAYGSLFILDTQNQRVRMVAPSGIISTVAGNGMMGYSGDGGEPTAAELYYPSGVTFTAQGSMLIADSGNNRIRVVATPSMTASTAAITPPSSPSSPLPTASGTTVAQTPAFSLDGPVTAELEPAWASLSTVPSCIATAPSAPPAACQQWCFQGGWTISVGMYAVTNGVVTQTWILASRATNPPTYACTCSTFTLYSPTTAYETSPSWDPSQIAGTSPELGNMFVTTGDYFWYVNGACADDVFYTYTGGTPFYVLASPSVAPTPASSPTRMPQSNTPAATAPPPVFNACVIQLEGQGPSGCVPASKYCDTCYNFFEVTNNGPNGSTIGTPCWSQYDPCPTWQLTAISVTATLQGQGNVYTFPAVWGPTSVNGRVCNGVTVDMPLICGIATYWVTSGSCFGQIDECTDGYSATSGGPPSLSPRSTVSMAAIVGGAVGGGIVLVAVATAVALVIRHRNIAAARTAAVHRASTDAAGHAQAQGVMSLQAAPRASVTNIFDDPPTVVVSPLVAQRTMQSKGM